MRKFFAIIFLLAAVILYFILFLRPISPQKLSSNTLSLTKKPSPTNSVVRNTLFVPYWSTNTITPGFSTYIYFGISPNENGIDTTDPGYTGIPTFVAETQGSKTLLTVTMLRNNTTEKILEDSSMQENIIQNSIQVAKSYGFNGIVLDLEYSGLAFPSVTKLVTDFSTRFAQEVHSQNVSFYQTLYGDTFYLARPYDVGAIAKESDGIFILAYDFHKANGTPGPNFPLAHNIDADYGFVDMINDFAKKVPKNKMTIIFGMFGYDWTVDDKNRPEKTAESLSGTDIQAMFLKKCLLKNCVVHRDPQTQEPSVTYVDDAGERHIVWYEDIQSVMQKEKSMQQKGISQVGFWANSYF